MTFKALCKQLFGESYERIGKSLIISIIIFCSLYFSEIRLAVAPFILYLTATMLSAAIMWQAISSAQNAERMTGIFMLPFENRRLVFSIVVSLGSYVLITKTFLVLAIFYAIKEWSLSEIAVSLLCACNGCLMTAVWYILSKRKKWIWCLLWGSIITVSIFALREPLLFLMIIFISIVISVLILLFTNAYVFYNPIQSAKSIVKYRKHSGSIFVYLLRYLLTNKTYQINTVGLCIIAGFLPFILGQFEGINIMPMGFAVLCLNTPICVLLSSDPDLEQTVRMLPKQASRFSSRYCFFIFIVNTAISSIYLISWRFQYGSVRYTEVLTALLFAMQSGVLSVLLEWVYPIRHWNTETDLFHHPRKYIVPAAMLLIAGVISISPLIMWIWLCIIMIECVSLLYISRRV